MTIDLALYQPDFAHNTGILIRLCACMGLKLHIIHPAAFAITPQALARGGLDYVEHAIIHQHASFSVFDGWRRAEGRRLVLMTTKSSQSAYSATFAKGDIIMLGRESAGVPDSVAELADLRLRIPMSPGLRSINVAMAGSMVVGEAMRQLSAFPTDMTAT
jgi:tRNA (cytidine/uridine-2'-O-)-methyltransferase